jgi:hypothetical protein
VKRRGLGQRIFFGVHVSKGFTVLVTEILQRSYDIASPIGYSQDLQDWLYKLESHADDDEWLLQSIRWCSRMLRVKILSLEANEAIDEMKSTL